VVLIGGAASEGVWGVAGAFDLWVCVVEADGGEGERLIDDHPPPRWTGVG
jgi:hypothetical protein